MLFIVGLGLHDQRDISLRGLDAVRKCGKIYLEAYTSLLTLGLGESATATLVSFGIGRVSVQFIVSWWMTSAPKRHRLSLSMDAAGKALWTSCGDSRPGDGGEYGWTNSGGGASERRGVSRCWRSVWVCVHPPASRPHPSQCMSVIEDFRITNYVEVYDKFQLCARANGTWPVSFLRIEFGVKDQEPQNSSQLATWPSIEMQPNSSCID